MDAAVTEISKISVRGDSDCRMWTVGDVGEPGRATSIARPPDRSDHHIMRKPRRVVKGARIAVGLRYAVPVARVIVSDEWLFVMLKKSTKPRSCRLPVNLNDFSTRVSNTQMLSSRFASARSA